MSIFQNSVVKTFKQDENLVAQRWAAYQSYKSKVEAIKDFKEEEYQDGFLKDIFENSLGYTLKTTNPSSFNLEREKKNETDSKKADGVIYLGEKVIGVIELKAQDTKNLDRVQQQAFYYLSQHSKAKYVIISNFDEIRFYIEKSTSYESFSLFNLSYEEFSKLHLILAYENIKDEIALKIKEKSNLFEQNISKNLYKDFSNFRTLLFDNLVKNNPIIEKTTLLRLTQKLCDRIIFILFAEDRDLLRTNTIKEIREEFINQKFTNYSLYDIYKFYFEAINKGNERLDIPQYNGGLFAIDELLDSLIIDDFILDENVQILSNYDFASEISVNILGHIFEQSLTDLEELQANIDNVNFDKTKSKRKKDGVFYTPEYITRYIVENTLGKMCQDKREELKIVDISSPSNPKKLNNREQQTKENLQEYKSWLLNLKILDPACGSGAFLNQALEYLISEHKNLQNDLALMGDLFASYMVEEEILENNLYGVDINEDAVEIAKLSLWLRTAKRGRALTKLADKIICANSLLEMPFSENSFDVVIGNPPYVRQEAIKEQKEALSKIYKVANGTADLYVYFYEVSLKVLKINGILGFITPNKFYKTNYAKELRNLLQSNKINILIDFFELKIFEDASTDSQIIILEKNYLKNHTFHYCPIKNIEEFQTGQYEQINIIQDNLKSEIWVFNNQKEKLILNKMFKKYSTLKEYTNNGIEYGIKTGLNKAFIIDKPTKEKIIKEDPLSQDLIKPYVSGTDIKRYVLLNSEQLYFINTYFDLDIYQYKGIYNWLMTFNDELLKREDKGKHHFNLRACKYYEKFNLPKIIYIHTAVEHSFYYDENGYYINNSCYLISNADKFLSAFLNSKMFKFYKKLNFVAYGDSSGNGRAKLDYNKMVNVPIPLIEDKIKADFIYKVDILREISKKLQELKQNFYDELKLEKLTNKLQKFEELDFDDFVKEYAKAKKLKFTDKLEERNFKNEWQRLFENDKKEILEIQNQINITDKEIDQMVYKLYDLTPDEIKIVENS